MSSEYESATDRFPGDLSALSMFEAVITRQDRVLSGGDNEY